MRGKEAEKWELQIEPDPEGKQNWSVWREQNQISTYLHSWHWSGIKDETSPLVAVRTSRRHCDRRQKTSAVPSAIKNSAAKNMIPMIFTSSSTDKRKYDMCHIQVDIPKRFTKKKLPNKSTQKKKTSSAAREFSPSYKPAFH